jgi:7-carboxy-7-deazaguanine synthase
LDFSLELPVQTHTALTPAEKRRPDVLRVNEIFYSVQGESSRAGERCTFVRMTGCGLRCSYCDTEYAFFEGVDMPVDEVMTAVQGFNCRLVELTGGEPLEQEGVYTLIDQLLGENYEVMIETGGHVDISKVDTRVKRVVDLKTPSSGMEKRNLLSNMQQLTKRDEVKFVIGSREDYDWAKSAMLAHTIADRAGTVLMSPVHGVLPESDLAGWILHDDLPVRYQVQLHKIIWPSTLRGV